MYTFPNYVVEKCMEFLHIDPVEDFFPPYNNTIQQIKKLKS